jgi:hypothetical protein
MMGFGLMMVVGWVGCFLVSPDVLKGFAHGSLSGPKPRRIRACCCCSARFFFEAAAATGLTHKRINDTMVQTDESPNQPHVQPKRQSFSSLNVSGRSSWRSNARSDVEMLSKSTSDL